MPSGSSNYREIYKNFWRQNKSGDIRPFTPNTFTNPYGTLQKHLATHLFQKIPFTNSDLTATLNTTPKTCTRENKTTAKLLEDAVTLINGLNPATNILIFLDGSSFPVTHACKTQTASSSAIVFFPSKNYSIETSIFLGNRGFKLCGTVLCSSRFGDHP